MVARGVVCGVLVIICSLVTSEARRYGVPGMDEVTGEDVLVNTHTGRLLGKRIPATPQAGGIADSVDVFIGVPYATPPVGNLRFKPPQPLERWEGVLNATSLPPYCPQDGYEREDEDCLFLNLYSPHSASAPGTVYPVLVYIHGGSYRSGSGSDYTGHILAQYGLVVVTINYRLGALGFLSSGDDDLPGNYGLMDQIAALRWLHINLPAFYGDPNRLTIAGNSAGGASVGLLTISPRAKGLFDRVVVQSGSPFAFWSTHNTSVDLKPYLRQLASQLDCTQSKVPQIVSCLLEKPWSSFVNIDYLQLPRISPSRTDIRPRVDGNIIPQPVELMYEEGRLNTKAVMTGLAIDEMSRHIFIFLSEELLVSKPHLDDQMNDGMDREMFKESIHHIVADRFWWHDSVSPIIVHEYTNWSNVDDPEENRHQFIQVMTDLAMLAPTAKLAQLCTKRNVPVFFYHFAHESKRVGNIYQAWQKSYHEIELSYVFGTPFIGYEKMERLFVNYTDEDRRMSQLTMQLWANFASMGDPSINGNTWHPYNMENGDFFSISDDGGRMGEHLRPEKVSFWNDLIPTMLRNLSTANRSKNEESRNGGFWALVVVCVTLLVLLLCCLAYISIRQKHVSGSG